MRFSTLLLLLFLVPVLCGWGSSSTTIVGNRTRTQYYLDATGGNNGWTGTSRGDPWATIAQLETATPSPGDELYLKRGEVWRDQLDSVTSGSIGNPITYAAYSTGAAPIISAANLLGDVWAVTGGGVYQTALAEPPQIFFDGTRGIIDDTACPANVDATHEWCWLANVLYVYSAGGDPYTTYTSPGMEYSARSQPFKIDGEDYITIKDLDLRMGSYSSVHHTGSSQGVVLEGIIGSNAYRRGLWSYGGSVTDLTIAGCDVSYSGGSGIALNNVDTALVTGNTVYNNGQLDILSPGDHDSTNGIRVYNSSTQGITIEGNEVYLNGKDALGNPVVSGERGGGIHFDNAGTGDVGRVVRYNDVYDNQNYGIMLELSTHYGEVYYNIVYDNDEEGIRLYNRISYSEIYNNVVYGNGAEGLELLGDGTASSIEDNTFKNNISTDNTSGNLRAVFGGENDGTNGSGNVYLNNGLDAEAPGFVEWGNGVFYNSYDAWETPYCGGGASCSSSVESDPTMTDPANGDFTLQVGSDAINAGTDVGLTRDIIGNSITGNPDVGAYEYQP